MIYADGKVTLLQMRYLVTNLPDDVDQFSLGHQVVGCWAYDVKSALVELTGMKTGNLKINLIQFQHNALSDFFLQYCINYLFLSVNPVY